ncbi:MAG: hypothetical protein ACLTE2_10100 [Eubacteriales bacterium]
MVFNFKRKANHHPLPLFVPGCAGAIGVNCRWVSHCTGQYTVSDMQNGIVI